MSATDLHAMWLAPEWRGVREVVPFPLRLDAAQTTNVHAAFRCEFVLEAPARVSIAFLGAHWFRCWLDGEYLADGPARFHPDHPEYDIHGVDLPEGRHVLAAHVLHEGVLTRLMAGDVIPPFIAASLCIDSHPIPIRWRCRRLEAYSQMAPRRSSLLGWSEQCDMRKLPTGWLGTAYSMDAAWHDPVAVDFDLSRSRELRLPVPTRDAIRPEPVASGWLEGSFSDYDIDVAVGFLRRRLEAAKDTANGRWWRYDLGRVMLGYARIRVRVASGATVETGIAETLLHGRVFPWCYYSEGPTCLVNRYIVAGDEVIEWHSPIGGRYVEVHGQVRDGVAPDLVDFEFIQRSFLPSAMPGGFSCGDESLNRVWRACVDTIRSCAEDALVDPVRERGQWTGDNMTVGLEALATLWGDLRLVERNAGQIAQCAREDGLVAALCPGTVGHFTSYALFWQHAVWQLSQWGSSPEFIAELMPAVRRNFDLFDAALGIDGLDPKLGDTFIDWGYSPAADLPDLATLAMLRRATRAMIAMDAENGHEHLGRSRALLERIDSYAQRFGLEDPRRLGYHATALLLSEGLIPAGHRQAAITFMKEHIADCFPMNPTAPRLRSPAEHNPRLITPYFFQYVLPVLLDSGGEEFALDLIRRCWGWGLDQGMTTIPEVFSDGWSQCHVWSCAPAWIIPRYGLGLHPKGVGRFQFRLPLTSLGHARGSVPIIGTDKAVTVEWEAVGSTMRYRLMTPLPINVEDATGLLPGSSQRVESCADWLVNLT